MADPFNWACRFCGNSQTANDENAAVYDFSIGQAFKSKYKMAGLKAVFMVCLNPQCKEICATADLMQYVVSGHHYRPASVISPIGRVPAQ